MTPPTTTPSLPSGTPATPSPLLNQAPSLRKKRAQTVAFGLLCGAATLVILLFAAILLGNVIAQGAPNISWRLLTSNSPDNMFDVTKAGLWPMIFGTVSLVMLMTLFCLPVGVATAVYLQEYSRPDAALTRLIRAGVSNLAGVPSIVFGLFGLGFFVFFIGGAIDRAAYDGTLTWGQPGLLWASLTMAALTLPVVIVSTEEALRAVPRELREASLALGATRFQTICRITVPQALPGILTGAILAIGRGAGEVAPILFTGAVFYMKGLPGGLHDHFTHLGYHTFFLSTQSPDIDGTKPLLFATVLILLTLTLLLNLTGILLRARILRKA